MAFDAEIKPEDADRIYIQRARDHIAKGWCQGQAKSGPNVCLVTALHMGRFPERAVDNQSFDGPEMNRLCGKLGFAGTGEAIRFNDYSARTKADVLNRLDNYLAGRPIPPDTTPDYIPNCPCPICKDSLAVKQMTAYQAAYNAMMVQQKFVAEPVNKPSIVQKAKGVFADLLTI